MTPRTITARRVSLPLTRDDERGLMLLRTAPMYRQALAASSEDGALAARDGASESAVIHAVFEAGLAAIRAAAEDAGYAELAEQRRADDSHRVEARRRRPSWADEP